eukprot:1917107-Pyramimonas_sp.AAC.1
MAGKMLVILAGYEADMEEMLKTNPGLKSRFAERLHFEDLSAEQTADLLTTGDARSRDRMHRTTDADEYTLENGRTNGGRWELVVPKAGQHVGCGERRA